jgi:hypothetical protein
VHQSEAMSTTGKNTKKVTENNTTHNTDDDDDDATDSIARHISMNRT